MEAARLCADSHVVDTSLTPAHQPFGRELPLLVTVRAEPLAARVMLTRVTVGETLGIIAPVRMLKITIADIASTNV